MFLPATEEGRKIFFCVLSGTLVRTQKNGGKFLRPSIFTKAPLLFRTLAGTLVRTQAHRRFPLIPFQLTRSTLCRILPHTSSTIPAVIVAITVCLHCSWCNGDSDGDDRGERLSLSITPARTHRNVVRRPPPPATIVFVNFLYCITSNGES